ncbi:L-threonylcarbamoyladenylate synthase [Beggiatoa leptomitoformis]|uniref:Threonylcarbamoyl-AMP synthase n=1 Tax=Beggiatoa leptomitoformis TaxID=288004 RepID=A0A2N9YFA3_9GAMM|nr:L-threonylcarbamoyladenylate synthase [Beggiatoa leptomitoformis]ALG68513.1 threonylcarbamoyl-AMP synthase [Beggiatoa leptomitoformis]AUI69147.1 threonylcarbamoyl-AMP synthase [Beggiatoa leptomitoformis]
MSLFLSIHPQNPQPRFISQVATAIRNGEVVVYPTDSCYALGCCMGDKDAMERIRRIRNADKDHNFTLVCRDLSEIATYAKVENSAFRLMKSLTPGAYTFLLKATHEVPRRLQHPKRKTIGLRVPDNKITLAILETLGEPIISSTLIMPQAEMPETDPEQILQLLDKHVDLIVDGGNCGFEPTTIIDLIEDPPVVLRRGKGSIDMFDTDDAN